VSTSRVASRVFRTLTVYAQLQSGTRAHVSTVTSLFPSGYPRIFTMAQNIPTVTLLACLLGILTTQTHRLPEFEGCVYRIGQYWYDRLWRTGVDARLF
jgi:hypothetical protein